MATRNAFGSACRGRCAVCGEMGRGAFSGLPHLGQWGSAGPQLPGFQDHLQLPRLSTGEIHIAGGAHGLGKLSVSGDTFNLPQALGSGCGQARGMFLGKLLLVLAFILLRVSDAIWLRLGRRGASLSPGFTWGGCWLG